MARVSLSGKEKSIDFILNWYEDQIEAIRDLRNKIVSSIIFSDTQIKVNSKFITLTIDEINEYFENSEDELEHLVCFDLISATEAFLRVDFNNRVDRKDKSDIGKTFRALNKKKGKKISLQEDIIETWKEATGDKSFSNFLGLLNYRHWLAHGRYYNPKLGREYSFDIAYEISENIFDLISIQN
jgi:hypothetical protein